MYFIFTFVMDHANFLHQSFLQLNPSKLEKNEDVNLNLANLLHILSELVEKIFMAAEILPPSVYSVPALFVQKRHLKN